jgi:DNA-binding IscR family transcriptional regulator
VCRLQRLMQRARNAVADVLENCSLAQLAIERKPDRREFPGRGPSKMKPTRSTVSGKARALAN